MSEFPSRSALALAAGLSLLSIASAWAQEPVSPTPVVATPIVADSSAGSLQPVVTAVVLRRDNGAGSAGVGVAQFSPRDRTQHFEVGVQGLPERNRIRWEFSALESAVGTRDRFVSVEEQLIIPLGTKEVLIHGTVALPRDWPLGRYRTLLTVNDSPLRMIDYVVGPEPTPLPAPPAIKEFAMFADDGRGKPGQARQQFTPQDRTIHFRAGLTARFSGNVHWKFTAVTTASGNNVTLLDLKGEVKDVDFLVSKMAAPKDWPIGLYRAELALLDQAPRSFEFTITSQ